MDKDISSIQGKVSKLETKLDNLDKLFKQLANNVSNLLKRNEFDKGQDSPLGVETQGPSKCIHDHSKKNEEVNKKDKVKATTENMQTLVDQVVDLIKTSQLVSCYSFVFFSNFVSGDLMDVLFGGLSHVVMCCFSMLFTSLVYLQTSGFM